MNWVKRFPDLPGFYWIKDEAEEDRNANKPSIAQIVDDGGGDVLVYFLGLEGEFYQEDMPDSILWGDEISAKDDIILQ